MAKLLETYNLLKLNQEESENLNTQITPSEIEAAIKKTPNKQKPWTGWLHRSILPNTPRTINTSSSQTISKNSTGRKTPKLILQGQHYPNSKTR